MKRILRVKIETVEVEDDYQLHQRNEPGEPFLIAEYDGHLYVSGEVGDQLYFINSDTKLNALSPLLQFMWWSAMAWQGFYPKIPVKLRAWMDRFNETKEPAAVFAKNIHARQSRRRDEIDSGQVKFRDWDPELFHHPHKLFSVN